MKEIIKHEAPKVVQPPTTYDLIGLTQDEINLLSYMMRVGGDPNGPRGLCDELNHKLYPYAKDQNASYWVRIENQWICKTPYISVTKPTYD